MTTPTTTTTATTTATTTTTTSSSSSSSNKKYLCAAPRPNEWEELEGKVLGGLGENAQAVLESTLMQLRTKYGWHPKTGPGRKSNAEHAIHLYEYLLDKVNKKTKKKTKKKKKKENGDGIILGSSIISNNQEGGRTTTTTTIVGDETTVHVEDEEKDEETKQTKQEDKNKNGNNNNVKEASNHHVNGTKGIPDMRMEEEKSKTHCHEKKKNNENVVVVVCNSKQQEQQEEEERNNICNVCYEIGGIGEGNGKKRLVMCTTCPLVFHLHCVRPVMTEYPKTQQEQQNWRCSYCILSTEAKNSKKRRDAAAAVRLMARLRNGIKRRKKAETVVVQQEQQEQNNTTTEPINDQEEKEMSQRQERISLGDNGGGVMTRDVKEEEEMTPKNGTTTTIETTSSSYKEKQKYEFSNSQQQNPLITIISSKDKKDSEQEEEEEEMTQKSGTRTKETTSSNKEEQKSEFSNSQQQQQHPSISVSSMSDKKVMEEEEMTQKSGTRTNETTSNKEEQRSEFSNSHQQHPPISVSSRDKKDVEEEEEEEEITQKSEFSNFQQNPPISSRDNSVGEEMAADSGSKDENEPDGNEDKSCDEEDDDTEGSAEEEEEEDDDDQREDEDRDESGSEDEAAINEVAEETTPDASDHQHDKGEKEVVEDGGGKHFNDNGDHLIDSNGQGCDDDDDKSESKTSDSPRKKRNLELSKLANTWTGRIESPERAGRGKRSRKQPTLYDPQLVPARNWQSDELNQLEDMTSENSDVEEKKGNGETQTVKEDAAKNETRGEETEIVGDNFQRHGEPRCTFCGDDPAITICCFCACRKCFGKRDHDKLLLCDECDDEYHIYCLDPPLTEIPTMTKWYCPSCTSSQTKLATKVITQSPVKRKVGRPPASPKVGRPSSSSTTTTKAGSPTASRKLIREKCEKLDNQPRRRRGRPPKNTVGAASPRRATGRKRGRPPKKPSSPSPPAKRLKPPLRSPDGRFISPPPPRTKTDPKPPSLHGAESKRLVASSSTKTIIVPVAVSSPTPVIVSRSGRTVKRSSFHDEIDEGEQHLKSSKQQVMVQVCKRASHMGTKKAATSERSGSGKRVVASVKTEELEDDKSGVEGMDVVAEPYDLTPSEQQQLASTDVVGKADMDVDVAPVARRTALSQVVPTTASSRESSKSLAMETAKAVSVSDEVANSASVDFGRRTTVSSGDPAGQPAVAYQNEPAPPSASTTQNEPETSKEVKVPRRKPGARECMQISRRFGCRVIPEKYIEILTDYCTRGKVEHLIRMRERLDEHSRYLESQLAGLLSLVKDKGDSDVVVPPLPEGPDRKLERTIAGDMFDN